MKNIEDIVVRLRGLMKDEGFNKEDELVACDVIKTLLLVCNSLNVPMLHENFPRTLRVWANLMELEIRDINAYRTRGECLNPAICAITKIKCIVCREKAETKN